MNIWVNGCFDILHTGHVDLLWYARNYIDNSRLHSITSFLNPNNKLYVGIDSDDRVKELKGNNRPINNQDDRKKMLSNLVMIDKVFIFGDDKQLGKFIKLLEIDYIVVGDHYKDKKVLGAEFTKYGVIYYPTDERSTTNIINKIRNL